MAGHDRAITPPLYSALGHRRRRRLLHRLRRNGQALAYVYFEDEPGRRMPPICCRAKSEGGRRVWGDEVRPPPTNQLGNGVACARADAMKFSPLGGFGQSGAKLNSYAAVTDLNSNQW
jgi:hypothetical protein